MSMFRAKRKGGKILMFLTQLQKLGLHTGWKGNSFHLSCTNKYTTRKWSALDTSAEGLQVKPVQAEYCIAMLRPTRGAGNSEALSSDCPTIMAHRTGSVEDAGHRNSTTTIHGFGWITAIVLLECTTGGFLAIFTSFESVCKQKKCLAPVFTVTYGGNDMISSGGAGSMFSLG